jgi:hypothetical protein
MPYKKRTPAGRPRIRANVASSQPPLLVERSEACRLLSISVATALRLEKVGRLKPVKLFPSPNGRTFYSYELLRALANGERADEAAS